METWRLLDIETPDRAAMNLAIEEAIFLAKICREVPPTVRFWRNGRAAVIGYSQKVEAEVNLELCRDEGIEIVRRFSGGGAVYQDLGNLNYTLVLDADHPIVEGLDIGESYRVFTAGVVEGLKEFGIDLVFDPPSDLLAGKGKVSGNAQSRKKRTILHHGTLLVNADLHLLAEVLDATGDRPKNIKITSKKRPVTNLADEIGRHVNMQEVKQALLRGFERTFLVKLVRRQLSSEEEESAQTLYAEKYSRREWNFWR